MATCQTANAGDATLVVAAVEGDDDALSMAKISVEQLKDRRVGAAGRTRAAMRRARAPTSWRARSDERKRVDAGTNL